MISVSIVHFQTDLDRQAQSRMAIRLYWLPVETEPQLGLVTKVTLACSFLNQHKHLELFYCINYIVVAS